MKTNFIMGLGLLLLAITFGGYHSGSMALAATSTPTVTPTPTPTPLTAADIFAPSHPCLTNPCG